MCNMTFVKCNKSQLNRHFLDWQRMHCKTSLITLLVVLSLTAYSAVADRIDISTLMIHSFFSSTDSRCNLDFAALYSLWNFMCSAMGFLDFSMKIKYEIVPVTLHSISVVNIGMAYCSA